MFSQSEHMYIITIVLSNDFDDIEMEITSEDFTEPMQEDISDLATTKHLVYYLAELFGEHLYESIDQDILDELEEMDLSEINEVQLKDLTNEVTYYINIHQKTIDKEWFSWIKYGFLL